MQSYMNIYKVIKSCAYLYVPLLFILSQQIKQNVMQGQFKQFIKTHLQLQTFYHPHEPNPTIQEINKAALMIELNYPNLNAALIVSHLYHTMNEVSNSKIVPALTFYQIMNTTDKFSQSKFNLQVQDSFQSNRLLKNGLKLKQTQSEIVKQTTLIRKFWIKNCPVILKNPSQQERYKVKQIVIDSFVQRGYGMGQFRQHIIETNFPIKVAYKKYAACITSLVTEAFKAIQKFLETNCNLLSQQLSKPDIRILHSILLNFAELTSKQAEGQQYFFVFCLFIKSIYNLLAQPVQINALSVYRTYQAIMRLLMIRQKQVSPLRFDQKQKISIFKQKSQKLFIRKQQEQVQTKKIDNKPIAKKWGKQSENQLAAFFVQLQDFGKVRERYRQIYGCITMFQNLITLRSYLYKIIRKSLRRAQKLSRVYGQHFSQQTIEMINLRNNQKYVQYVLTSPQFMDSRVLLCKLHNVQQKDFDLINSIGKSIGFGLAERQKSSRNIVKLNNKIPTQ